MKQTAVEWFFNQIKHILPNDFLLKYDQAKEMEKKQIERAFMFGQYTVSIENGEQYYNETFKNK